MHVFDKIVTQVRVVGLPVVAVSLTAVPRANTPVLLVVHWHGFAERQSPNSMQFPAPQKSMVGIPGSALQINEMWTALEHLDDAMLEAAWQLGAWDLVREERRGCNTAGASEKEAQECRQAFCQNPFGETADEYMLTEAPDRMDLMQLGARVGYVRWQFHPVKNGVWQGTAPDDTLMADGSRGLPCPVLAKPTVGMSLSQTRYHLGRSSRIVLL